MNRELAERTVKDFLNRFDESYEPLLYYAALPLILTPELLHYLRHHFTPQVPFVAEVDLLLSEDICQERTFEQYTMNSNIRNYLLAEARSKIDIGQAAGLLMGYLRDLERSRSFISLNDLQAQAWSAMVYMDEYRGDVVEQIQDAFRRIVRGKNISATAAKTEIERLARLTEAFSEDLTDYPDLVEYARLTRKLLKHQASKDDLEDFEIAYADLPSPAELLADFSGSPKQEKSPLTSSAYLILDVDSILQRFRTDQVDIQELAVVLRVSAAFAAGLASADHLKSIAFTDWQLYDEDDEQTSRLSIFRAAGYDIFDIPSRDMIADMLIVHYFSYDPSPVDELILATNSRDLLSLIPRLKRSRNARIRLWGSEDILQGTEFADDIIFQPLEALFGVQTKNVAVYIDFENIATCLNEQGFVVNLDHLIDRFVVQAKAHGSITKMAAYAPWGQRGTLPPLVDSNGREIADEAPGRLALANIDPVFNLPGKNSASIRIARDIITDVGHSDSADVYILASGDRDFSDLLNTLLRRNRTVIVWGIRGSTSRMLETNTSLIIQYIDDFTNLQTHRSLGILNFQDDDAESFNPSRWTSVVVQYDRLTLDQDTETLPISQLVERLQEVGTVVSRPHGEDLVSQAISLGILKPISINGRTSLNGNHPIVDKTRFITDRIVRRVESTLEVRGWEYINYGFLLKGLAMDSELNRPGCNLDDQWRSHWIDSLVREQLLERKLVPDRRNPDDLIPVINLPQAHIKTSSDVSEMQELYFSNITLDDLRETENDTYTMVYRVIVSVEQFTSFRNFAWCPTGSLHRRLHSFDNGMSFQRAVNYLISNNAAEENEYKNPQSNYSTKGISLNRNNPIIRQVLLERDEFVNILIELYKSNMLISGQNINAIKTSRKWDLQLWFSIMETENILNALPNRPGQFSLFRSHHTVVTLADSPDRFE